MNIQEKFDYLTYTATTLPPAQLWVGSHDQLVQHAESLAQQLFCPHNSCQTCVTCMHIRDKQYHGVLWFYPDKTYTIEQLDSLFTTITFRLQPNETFLFIIQKADLLTISCANKLLKSIEEPPAGYHFILLTERKEPIPPTIISRCTLHSFSNTKQTNNHPLVTSFTIQKPTMMEFSKTLETCGVNEQDSITLLDEILAYWMTHYKTNTDATEKEYSFIDQTVTVLKNAYSQLPMPGSSTLFWRNLFLQIHEGK